MILVQRYPDAFQPAKLLALFRSPYEVIHQERNRVECRHLATYHIRDVPVEHMKIFHGTREQAVESANQDEDQTVIQAVTGWKGDPFLRSTISLRILFADGDAVWLPLTKDVDAAMPVGEYFLKTPILRHLAFQPTAVGVVWVREKRKERLLEYKEGETIYVDLRSYGHRWYDERLLALEQRFDKIYVLEYIIQAVFNCYIHAECPLLGEIFNSNRRGNRLDAWWCYAYTYKELDENSMVLVDQAVLAQCPLIISEDKSVQDGLLQQCK